MGWAKYYEDNMSIYIERIAMREVSHVFYEKPERINVPVVKVTTADEKKTNIVVEKPEMSYKNIGRKGLKVVFQNGIDEGMIRKMQLNGWWWSKRNACWCNQDTKGNRKYVKSLNEAGTRASIVL